MKRLFAAGCASILLLGGLAQPASALTPSYTVSASYRSSTYYQNMLSLPVTGDPAFDTVAVAMSQLNYEEGNSASSLGGTAGGSGNFTEYNRAFGKVGGSFGYAWCASFVTWCLQTAGAGESAGGKFASCTLWIERLQSLGLYKKRSSGYTPRPGDLIFFRSAGTARTSDHVGLVRHVKNGRVYTVEGNSSNKVSLRDYALSDTYIVGYGCPDYDGIRLGADRLALEDKTAGFYTVTHDFVNIRSKANASAAKLGSLPRGSLVKITEATGGWGRIVYNGKPAYLSLEYADFTAPLSYRVTYRVGEGSGAPVHTDYFSHITAQAADAPLPPDGTAFLAWQDAAGDRYLPGDTLPAGDLILEAVYEALPSPPQPETDPGGGGSAAESAPFSPEAGWEIPPTSPEDMPLPDGASPPSANTAVTAAAQQAGTTTGLLAACLGLWWYVRRFFSR